MPPLKGWQTGIYQILNTVTGKVYVGGASVSFRQRFQEHRKGLRNGKSHNRHLQRAWDLYGAGAFRFLVLERCSPARVNERETWWISQLDATNPDKGYNICSVAQSWLGCKHTEETRARLSAMKIGQPGRHTMPHTEEARAKMSATKKALYQTRPGPRTGAVLSEATKAKIAATKVGKKHTPEARAKMSAARKGRKLSEEHRANSQKNHWSKGPRAKEIAAKIAAKNLGHPCSPEVRARISATKRRARLEPCQ